jgi:hypothetical protein
MPDSGEDLEEVQSQVEEAFGIRLHIRVCTVLAGVHGSCSEPLLVHLHAMQDS